LNSLMVYISHVFSCNQPIKYIHYLDYVCFDVRHWHIWLQQLLSFF
jgi:hypothetical protein